MEIRNGLRGFIAAWHCACFIFLISYLKLSPEMLFIEIIYQDLWEKSTGLKKTLSMVKNIKYDEKPFEISLKIGLFYISSC